MTTTYREQAQALYALHRYITGIAAQATAVAAANGITPETGFTPAETEDFIRSCVISAIERELFTPGESDPNQKESRSDTDIPERRCGLLDEALAKINYHIIPQIYRDVKVKFIKKGERSC